jgi:hypothetical protein
VVDLLTAFVGAFVAALVGNFVGRKVVWLVGQGSGGARSLVD